MKQPQEYFKNIASEEKMNSSTYMTALKAIGLCFIMSFLLIVVYSMLLSYTPMSDGAMSKVTLVIIITSIATSTIYGGKRIAKKGWLFGLAVGLLYTMVVIPLGAMVGQSAAFDAYTVAKMAMGGAVGLVGGIIGVNLK